MFIIFREEEYLIEADLFRRNAFLVIKEMVAMLLENNKRRSELVDEVCVLETNELFLFFIKHNISLCHS